jgi:hypothetical protein
MRRYEVQIWSRNYEPYVEFEAVPSGTWVEWADCEAVMKERDLLRAECEAFRKLRSILHSFPSASHDEYLQALEVLTNARKAVDDAGILKGATNE